MASCPHSAAAERNREPIVAVLRTEFRDCKTVLEIGSGSGQHAVWFAAELPWLRWQPSDLAQNLAGINAWIDHAGGENVLRPLLLDVRQPPPFDRHYDALFTANTAHIMCIDGVEAMFDLAGRVLKPGGILCLYGPIRENGEFDTDSNRRFDQSLRMQDAKMGIRDLEVLDQFAGAGDMTRLRRHAMPANNQILVWRKAAGSTEVS